MSSYLFSPICLNPLQGILDFTSDVKPFRTKVVEAGISLSFSDEIKLGITEQLLLDVDQLFHRHVGNCYVPPVPCVTDGFESEVYDDTFGFEPTIRYDTIELSLSTPTTDVLNFVGYGASGLPVFVVGYECLTSDTICPEGFEMVEYDVALFDYADPECLDTCNYTMVGKCTTGNGGVCTDISSTTIGASFTEALSIVDDQGVELMDPGRLRDTPSRTIRPVLSYRNVAPVADQPGWFTREQIEPVTVRSDQIWSG
jgi:hypothetical protein